MTPSRQSRIVAFVMYWLLRPLGVVFARPRFVPLLRWYIEAITPAPRKGTAVEPGGPRGEWVRGPGVAPNKREAILYFHGSGYVVCSPKTHRGLISELTRRAGVPAYSVDYRLAPEDPYPAAADDALEAYRYLVEAGYERIVVAGDSAGGQLALALVAELSENELPEAAGLLLFSPVVDPSFETAAKVESEVRDPMFTAGAARRILSLYTQDADLEDARLAVLRGDPSVMPPVLLHAGSREMLMADACALDEWFDGAGIPSNLKIWPGQVHVFQMLYGIVPEARQALAEAGEFVRHSLSGNGTSAGERPAPSSSQAA